MIDPTLISIKTNKNDLDIFYRKGAYAKYTSIEYSKEVFLLYYSEVNNDNILKFINTIIDNVIEFIGQDLKEQRDNLINKIKNHINNYDND
jgi:hypothetical protein